MDEFIREVDSLVNWLQRAAVRPENAAELKELRNNLKRFELKLIEKIQSIEPPTLAVNVSDGIDSEDAVR